MKTCYIDIDTRSIVDLVKPGELTSDWTITRINVPREHRSKGYGTAMLKRVLIDADAEGIALQLEPVPSGGMDYDHLVAWYSSHGFKMTDIGYMQRMPQ